MGKCARRGSRFDPAGDRTSLVPLPVPVEMPGDLVFAALSPDGTRLAVAVVATGGRTLIAGGHACPLAWPSGVVSSAIPAPAIAW